MKKPQSLIITTAFSISLCLSILHTPATLSAEEAPILSMDELIALAKQNAPAMALAADEVAIAETRQLEAALAQWLPEISLYSSIAPSGPVEGNPMCPAPPPPDNDPNFWDFLECDSTSETDLDALQDLADQVGYQTINRIRATFPIYAFGKLRLSRELADVGFEVATLEERKAELELIFNVRQAYWGLQLSKAFEDIIAEGQERLQDARENLESRLFDGDLTARTELRRLTIQEADLVGRVADNRQLGRLAERALRFYCQIEGDFSVEPLDETADESLPVSLDEALLIATAERPDLSLLNLAVEATEIRDQLALSQMLPNIFFALAFNYNHNPLADDQNSPFASDPYNSSGLGFFLGLDWRFNFRRIAQLRRAHITADSMKNQQREAIGGIEIEIEDAYLQAQGHLERVTAYRTALDAADAWLRQRTTQFDSGLASYEDLSEPLLAYFRAYVDFYQALFDSRLAIANLALKIGLESFEESSTVH